MSFDVYILSQKCEHCGRGEDDSYSFNLTHNVNEIVERCLVAAGAGKGLDPERGYVERSWGRLHGWTVEEALPIVERALAVATSSERRAEFRALEPENGWGQLVHVIEVMTEFVVAMKHTDPKSIIRVSG